MPEVKPNESKEDFIPRCTPIIMGEGVKQDEAVARCNVIWGDYVKAKKEDSKLKIETTEILGREICYPGTFLASTGKVEVTEKTIDDFISNFERGVIDPPALNLDHDDKFTNEIKKSLGVLRLGTVKRLYKDGKGLIADFHKVPLKIADLINSGLMNLRSIEFSKKFNGINDAVHDNVLRAVTFFGNDLPAIPGLRDLIPSLLQETKSIEGGEIVTVNLKEKESIMSENDIHLSRGEYDKLQSDKYENVKMKIDLDNANKTIEKMAKDHNEAVTKLKADIEVKDTEIDKLKVESEQVAKDKEQLEKDKDANLKKECEKFIDNDVVKATKILPKYREQEVNRLFELEKACDKEKVALYKEEILSRGAAINLAPNPDGGPVGGNIVEFKHRPVKSEAEIDNLNDDAMKHIDAYMQANNCTFEVAITKLGIANDSEFMPVDPVTGMGGKT